MVSHAFHSQLLEPILPAFEQVAAGVKFSDPATGFISNLTGKSRFRRAFAGPRKITGGVTAREPVQFMAGIRSLVEQGVRIFIEIGPSPGVARHGGALRG